MASKAARDTGQQALRSSGKNKEEDSKCCDSIAQIQVLTNGIVGILEGFGLLDDDANQEILSVDGQNPVEMDTGAVNGGLEELQKTLENLLQALGEQYQTGGANVHPDNEKMILQDSARMPLADLLKTLPPKARQELKELSEKVLCSFENANNQGSQKEWTGQADLVPGMERRMLLLKNAEDRQNNPLPNAGMGRALQLNADIRALKNARALQAAKSENDLQNSASPAGERRGAAEVQKSAGSPPNAAGSSQMNAGAATFPDGPAVKNGTGTPDVQQTAAPAAGSGEMAENISHIVKKISTSVAEGKQEFDVTLKPDFLGKIHIKLMMDESGIKASIKAGDATVKGLIADRLPMLQEMLREKSIHVTNIDVAYESAASEQYDSYQQPYRQNNGQFENGQSMKGIFKTGVPEKNDSYISDVPYLTGMYSSVEFQA